MVDQEVAFHLQRPLVGDRTGIRVEVAQVEVVDRHLHAEVVHDLDRRELVVRVDDRERPPRDVVLQPETVGPELHLPGVFLGRVLEGAALRDRCRP